MSSHYVPGCDCINCLPIVVDLDTCAVFSGVRPDEAQRLDTGAVLKVGRYWAVAASDGSYRLMAPGRSYRDAGSGAVYSA